jgi:hypothetical protein
VAIAAALVALHPSVSGFNLTVRAGWVKTSTGWHYRDSETIDLTTSKPVTGARFTLVTVDDGGLLVVTDGTPAASLFDLALSDIPDLPTVHTPICAVRLYAGQTSIRDQAANTDLIDLRFTSIGGDEGAAAGEIEAPIGHGVSFPPLAVPRDTPSRARSDRLESIDRKVVL